ncbi:universal stress protein [Haloarchaeobius sp. DFWS5]|uniref:universal stress protein n=1 Tax=Haloarchaeobius sp. DFWS5 TaxID=3446114 RepID=UPI003EBA3D83
MGDVLVAVDGSEHAYRAAEHAIGLAEERGGTLHCLCVIDERKFGEPALSSDELASVHAEDHGHECGERVEAAADKRNVPVVREIRHGVPDETILDYANDTGAEVIVLGEHGDHADHIGGLRRRLEKQSDVELVVVGAERKAY